MYWKCSLHYCIQNDLEFMQAHSVWRVVVIHRWKCFCYAADCLLPFRATVINCQGFTFFCFICHYGSLFVTIINSGFFPLPK
jgi:hypothetical protein